MAAEIIDITKPGSNENIKLGDSVPVVELDKINSIGRWKDIPLSDTPGLIVPAYAPDEETKAVAEVLETLQKQQPAAGHHGSSNLSTPPGEAEYFEGGLMRTVQESVKRQKMCSSPVSQPFTPVTAAGSILTITVGILPPGKSASRGFNKSYPQGRFTQLTQGGFEVHWQESYQ